MWIDRKYLGKLNDGCKVFDKSSLIFAWIGYGIVRAILLWNGMVDAIEYIKVFEKNILFSYENCLGAYCLLSSIMYRHFIRNIKNNYCGRKSCILTWKQRFNLIQWFLYTFLYCYNFSVFRYLELIFPLFMLSSWVFNVIFDKRADCFRWIKTKYQIK